MLNPRTFKGVSRKPHDFMSSGWHHLTSVSVYGVSDFEASRRKVEEKALFKAPGCSHVWAQHCPYLKVPCIPILTSFCLGHGLEGDLLTQDSEFPTTLIAPENMRWRYLIGQGA